MMQRALVIGVAADEPRDSFSVRDDYLYIRVGGEEVQCCALVESNYARKRSNTIACALVNNYAATLVISARLQQSEGRGRECV